MVKAIDDDRLKVAENLTIKDNANLSFVIIQFFLIDIIDMFNWFGCNESMTSDIKREYLHEFTSYAISFQVNKVVCCIMSLKW